MEVVTTQPSEPAPPELSAFETSKQRAFIYRLLGEVLGDIPGPRVIKALAAPEIASVFAEFGFDLGLSSLPVETSTATDALAAEYGWLFSGPANHLPPYESLYVADKKRELWGPSTQRVKRRMAAWGLEPKQKGRVPDHIGVELDFMAHLAAAEAALVDGGDDPEKLRRCRQAQRIFLDEHLLLWVPTLADLVAVRARLPLYRELLRFTVQFLRFDRESFIGAET